MEHPKATTYPSEKQSMDPARTTAGEPSNPAAPVDYELPPYSDGATFEDIPAAAGPSTQPQPVPQPQLQPQPVRAPDMPARPQPVRLSLLNPRNISSGFTLAVPDALRVLSSRQFDAEQWTRFVRELNAVLSKAPGTIAKEVTDFWLVSLITLGAASTSTKIYAKRIRQKALETVERWNRVDLAQMGLHVRLNETTVATHEENVGDSHYRRHGKRFNEPDSTSASVSLELVVDRL